MWGRVEGGEGDGVGGWDEGVRWTGGEGLGEGGGCLRGEVGEREEVGGEGEGQGKEGGGGKGRNGVEVEGGRRGEEGDFQSLVQGKGRSG